jgi:hypothetical protein
MLSASASVRYAVLGAPSARQCAPMFGIRSLSSRGAAALRLERRAMAPSLVCRALHVCVFPRPLAQVGTLCNDEVMAKTVIVKLTDDLDGGDADETVTFALDGRSYEIDVSSANAAKLRDAFRPFVEKARPKAGGGGSDRPARSASAPATLYSQLKDNEKARFRAWADMATARRISDARVKSWIAAGRP